jgi:DNA repair exonuclease SbcCD nuclease subunit
MALKIIVTSDLHIGLKFAAYPEVQDRLIEARFKTLEMLVAEANVGQVDLFVVAGDLFDRLSVAKKDIVRIREILGEFHGKLVAVLPGNHDYLTTADSDVWSRFDEGRSGNILVLRKQEPYPLLQRYDIDACLYPGPCMSKHSSKNAIGWIVDAVRDKDVSFHIGIAHGSLEGVSPDFNGTYFPMTRKDLDGKGIDCWLLGHTHLQWHESNIFYPGTAEPDGFDCLHGGKAWMIELEKGQPIKTTSLNCGTYWFGHANESVNKPEDLDRIAAHYNAPEYRNCLLKLELTGRLPREQFHEIADLRERVSKSVLSLCSFTNQVREEISPKVIDEEFTAGSFPHRLLTELSQNESDSQALQITYELLSEVRK